MSAFGSDQYIRHVLLKRDTVPSFDEYPFCIPAVRNLKKLDLHPKVTFFVGDNGTGKSTLLEAIALVAGFNAEGGSKNYRFATRESHSELCKHIALSRGITREKDGFFLRAESYFNVATEAENLGVTHTLGGNPHEKSHGEAFLSLLTERLGGNGLYLLDEPEAALSPLRQMSVLSVIHDLAKRNSQFIIVTHSPIIMAYPDSRIYLFSDDAIGEIDYTETEHYNVTRDFLNRHEMMLRTLLRERD